MTAHRGVRPSRTISRAALRVRFPALLSQDSATPARRPRLAVQIASRIVAEATCTCEPGVCEAFSEAEGARPASSGSGETGKYDAALRPPAHQLLRTLRQPDL